MTNYQENFLQALKQSAQELRREELGCQKQIGQSLLFITLGDQVCRELKQSILPEFLRRWPKSFRKYDSDRRISVCAIDRNADTPFDEENMDCCLHYQLQAAVMKRLSESEQECRGLSEFLRGAVGQLQGNGLGDCNVIVAVNVENPDSLLAGDVAALARRICRDLLYCNCQTALVALLPENHRSKQQQQQTTDFFLDPQFWQAWSRPGRDSGPVYARFPDEPLEAFSPEQPCFRCAYLLDGADVNFQSCIEDGRRAKMLADVLAAGPIRGKSGLYVPVRIPAKLGYEHILIRAADRNTLANCVAGEADFIEDNFVQTIMQGSVPIDDVKRKIADSLQLACIACRSNGAMIAESRRKAEQLVFGSMLSDLYQQWEADFLEQAIPKEIMNRILACSSQEELLCYEEELRQLTKLNVQDHVFLPDAATGMPYFIEDPWTLRDKLVEEYCTFAENSRNKLFVRWAQEALVKVRALREGFQDQGDLLKRFDTLRKNVEGFLNQRQAGISDYQGPVMTKISRRSYSGYVGMVVRAINAGTVDEFVQVLKQAAQWIESERQPETVQGEVLCRLSDADSFRKALPAETIEIRNELGELKEQIQLKRMEQLSDSRFLYFECGLADR